MAFFHQTEIMADPITDELLEEFKRDLIRIMQQNNIRTIAVPVRKRKLSE
jgi:hypothetical protein